MLLGHAVSYGHLTWLYAPSSTLRPKPLIRDPQLNTWALAFRSRFPHHDATHHFLHQSLAAWLTHCSATPHLVLGILPSTLGTLLHLQAGSHVAVAYTSPDPRSRFAMKLGGIRSTVLACLLRPHDLYISNVLRLRYSRRTPTRTICTATPHLAPLPTPHSTLSTSSCSHYFYTLFT